MNSDRVVMRRSSHSDETPDEDLARADEARRVLLEQALTEARIEQLAGRRADSQAREIEKRLKGIAGS